MAEVIRDTMDSLYQQIADDIKGKVDREELKPNTKIPTEAELSAEYGVSRVTIRKALELLVEEEILVRKQGIGTFVSNKKLYRDLNFFMGFTQSCELSGKKAGTKFLAAELVQAMPSDIKRLGLKENDQIIRIRRLRYCDDMPVILEEIHFPKQYAYLLSEDLTGSIHQLLASHGVALTKGKKTIGVCYATREEAQLLDIEENTALIMSKDMAYTEDDVPVYSGKDIINAERYEYQIRTSNKVQYI